MEPWIFSTFSINVQLDIHGRPLVSIRTFNLTYVDVRLFHSERKHDIRGHLPISGLSTFDPPIRSTNFNIDVCGRITGNVLLYNMTSVDVHQFLYGRTRCGPGRPPVTIWTYNLTYADIHQFLSGCLPCDSGCPPVSIQTCIMTSTSFSMYVQYDIRGRPSASIWTYKM